MEHNLFYHYLCEAFKIIKSMKDILKSTIAVVVFLIVSTVFAQQRQPTAFVKSNHYTQPILHNWTFGGNIGVTYNNGGFGMFLTPRVGFLIIPNFEISANVNYTFQNSSFFRTNLFGIGPAINYYFFPNLYLYCSFQHYFVSQKSKQTLTTYQINENALYLGGGYMQKIGSRTYLQMGASYNILYKKDKSIFSTGFVPNIGVIIGVF